MRAINVTLLFVAFAASTTLFAVEPAKTTQITCDAPTGTRIDYFTKNSAGVENNKFLMGRDKASQVNPHIIFNSASEMVEFSLHDASKTQNDQDATPVTASMKVIAYSDNQITFAGILNNAPIMATYYSKLHILIFSEQNIWPGDDLEGARATLFYSRCTEDATHP